MKHAFRTTLTPLLIAVAVLTATWPAADGAIAGTKQDASSLLEHHLEHHGTTRFHQWAPERLTPTGTGAQQESLRKDERGRNRGWKKARHKDHHGHSRAQTKNASRRSDPGEASDPPHRTACAGPEAHRTGEEKVDSDPPDRIYPVFHDRRTRYQFHAIEWPDGASFETALELLPEDLRKAAEPCPGEKRIDLKPKSRRIGIAWREGQSLLWRDNGKPDGHLKVETREGLRAYYRRILWIEPPGGSGNANRQHVLPG